MLVPKLQLGNALPRSSRFAYSRTSLPTLFKVLFPSRLYKDAGGGDVMAAVAALCARLRFLHAAPFLWIAAKVDALRQRPQFAAQFPRRQALATLPGFGRDGDLHPRLHRDHAPNQMVLGKLGGDRLRAVRGVQRRLHDGSSRLSLS